MDNEPELNIIINYNKHISESSMTERQKKALLKFSDKVKIIEKKIKKSENGFYYYIKLDIGWDIIEYECQYNKYIPNHEEIENNFKMCGFEIVNDKIIIKNEKTPSLFPEELIGSFRIIKEMVDFTNKIILLDNIVPINVDYLQLYRNILKKYNSLKIPIDLKKYIQPEDIDIIIDDGSKFDIDKSLLYQNVTYHYVINSDKYSFKLENENKNEYILSIYYLFEMDIEPIKIIKSKEKDINTFWKFLKKN